MIQQTEKQKILIVDDMPVNVQVLAEGLKDDYRIKATTQGRKALEISASDDPPDLILLDVMMPDLDGYSICRQLKSEDRTRNIPVIFITARDHVEDEIRGLEVGAVDYVTKPFHLPIIKARVRTHLDLKRKYDILESMVSLDGLTEIPNRRRFEESLATEWRRAQRSGSSLTLIMIDIDHFKEYNDHYGHSAGDRCLKTVAWSINSTPRRPADVVARYGGEEFAAILPDTEVGPGRDIAEKMRRDVEARKIVHAYSSVAGIVTISLGGATQLPIADRQPHDLVQLADRMLYRAKSSGRNQVAWSDN